MVRMGGSTENSGIMDGMRSRFENGGDVDKGADKMYATMKKLEDRVA